MILLVEVLISALLVVGGFFALVGSFGLIKLGDPMTRLHAPTKATTLGVGSVLIASMLYFAVIEGAFSFHELLISLFLFLTAPITANFIAKAYLLHRAQPEALPRTERDCGWANFDAPKRDAVLTPPLNEDPAQR
ncbi:MAG: Na+/H+ antiporter subunit G [Rhodovibrionaceae bacterium]